MAKWIQNKLSLVSVFCVGMLTIAISVMAQNKENHQREIYIRWGQLNANEANVREYRKSPNIELVNGPPGTYIHSFEIWLIYQGDTIKQYWQEAHLDTFRVTNPINLEIEQQIVQREAGFSEALMYGNQIADYVLPSIDKLVAGDAIVIRQVILSRTSGSHLRLPGPFIFKVVAD